MGYTFRPHHFLCTLCFQGKGYSAAFIRNYKQIVRDLKNEHGDDTVITVTAHTDSICSACPSKMDLLCKTQEKIEKLDTAHASVLNVHDGDVLTWGEAKQRIKTHMTLDNFHASCEPCSWKAYGICEGVLEGFLKD